MASASDRGTHGEWARNRRRCHALLSGTVRPVGLVGLVRQKTGLRYHLDRLDALQTIHNTNTLPLRGDGTGQLIVALDRLPRLVRVSVNGYARVGLATVRIRTLDTDGLLPRRVAATGGQVTDAGHLLTWDRKAALFNEPDVAAKWLTHDAASDNFVLLEF